MVRTAGDPARLAGTLRQVTSEHDAALTLDNATAMTEIVERTQGPWRFNMLVFGAFAGVALLLAAIGLFGLVAYTVGQRTREIGLRLALGASRMAVVRLMVRQGTQPVAVGLIVGVIASLALTRLVAALLFEVSATDPLIFGGATLALLAVAIVACYVPARRSARVDPMIALRVE
jgi:ABC-type antimicrobial peptide transport system permease subunit